MAYFIPVPTNIATVPDVSSTYGVPMAFISGFEMSYLSGSQFLVNAGNANAENNGATIQYPSVQPYSPSDLTVDVTVLAAPGLTQGNQTLPSTSGVFPVSIASLGLANTTTFPVYAVSDSSGKYTPLIVVATANNFVPVPYFDTFRRIGFVTINTSGVILPFTQSGSFTDREYFFQDGVAVVTAGASQSLVAVDLSAGNFPIVPGPTSKVFFRSLWLPNAAADTCSITPTGLTPTTYPVVLKNAAAVSAQQNWELIPGINPATGGAAVSYINSAATGAVTLWVVGFKDSLRLQVV